MKQFERTIALIGQASQQKLLESHVAVFGLGGVGSYVVEALARAGVGKLTLVDFDTVSQTNLNRQLFALCSTLGQLKTDVAKHRVLDINPNAEVHTFAQAFNAETASLWNFSQFDYVVDAIDTVTSKVLLAKICGEKGVPVISCMGAGNKLDPTRFRVCDIFQTSVCPLAKVMRKLLRENGVEKLKVVYSDEAPISRPNDENARTPASISFVPSAAGLVLASEVVKDLTKN